VCGRRFGVSSGFLTSLLIAEWYMRYVGHAVLVPGVSHRASQLRTIDVIKVEVAECWMAYVVP
jgi:hypothetical protein